jgi:hypothetical protein
MTPSFGNSGDAGQAPAGKFVSKNGKGKGHKGKKGKGHKGKKGKKGNTSNSVAV